MAERRVVVDTDATAERDYASISAAVTGELAISGDLVGDDDHLVIECRCSSSAQDTAAVTISSDWTLDEDHYIEIYVDPEYRHNGSWVSSAYTLYVTSSRPIQLNTPYVAIKGIQIDSGYNTGGYQDAINYDGTITGGTIWIEDTIVCNSIWFYYQGNSNSAGNNVIFKNCIAFDMYGNFASMDDTAGNSHYTLYNCLTFNTRIPTGSWHDGMVSPKPNLTFDFYNCISYPRYGNSYLTSGFVSGSCNMGGVGTMPGDSGVTSHYSTIFTSPGETGTTRTQSRDFSLLSGGSAVGAGIHMTANTRDITGKLRDPDNPDIGPNAHNILSEDEEITDPMIIIGNYTRMYIGSEIFKCIYPFDIPEIEEDPELEMSVFNSTSHTWTEVFPPGGEPANRSTWHGEISGDGRRLVVSWDSEVGGAGRCYIGENTGDTNVASGWTWSSHDPTLNVTGGSTTSRAYRGSYISEDGSRAIQGVGTSRLWMLTFSSMTWSEIRPDGDANRDWRLAIRLSKDGRIILAAANARPVNISTDWGNTWYSWGTETFTTLREWTGCDMSSDGRHILIGQRSTSGQLWYGYNSGDTSINSGWTWTDVSPDNHRFRGCAISENGQYMLAPIEWRRVWLSTNSGGTWTEIYPPGGTAADRNWAWACVSKTGQYMTVGHESGTPSIFGTNDYGETWSYLEIAGNTASGFFNNNNSIIFKTTYNGRLHLGISPHTPISGV
jgi:hypothetical protein